MFKKVYVRGIAKALMDCEAVKFANEDQAIAAADQVAERLPEQPVGEVAPEITAELAANLVDLSNSLQQSADSAAQAATAVAGPEAAAGPEMEAAKAASLRKAAAWFRQKLSADTGSTIVGDRPEQENRSANSTNAEARLDERNRPGGDAYANVGEDGVGKQTASGQGAIASETKREDNAMGPAEGGSNSATEAVKGASLRRIIRAAALGKTAETVPGTTVAPGKTFPDAVTGEGAMDKNRRPAGYAAKGENNPGASDQAAAARAAAIGNETPHPGQESHTGGTNTAIKQSADEQYIRELRVLGQQYGSRLPFYMKDNEKVAALQYLKGLPPSERDLVMNHVEKTAEIPEGLKNYIEAKKGKDGEDDEEPSDEDKAKEEADKKEADKKASATKTASAHSKDSNILARLRRMNASA